MSQLTWHFSCRPIDRVFFIFWKLIPSCNKEGLKTIKKSFKSIRWFFIWNDVMRYIHKKKKISEIFNKIISLILTYSQFYWITIVKVWGERQSLNPEIKKEKSYISKFLSLRYRKSTENNTLRFNLHFKDEKIWNF